ncbi:MAG: DEAD/DEAH box helicase [Rhodanobacter sp.]
MDTRSLHERLNNEPWQTNFDSGTLGRAADYHLKHRIVAVWHRDNGDSDVLCGIAKGNQNDPYFCSITLKLDGKRLRLDSICTCPVGSRCKHAAALLFTATAAAPEYWPQQQAAAAYNTLSRQSAVSLPQTTGPETSARQDALTEWNHWLQELTEHDQHTNTHAAETERQFGVLLRGSPHGTPPGLQINLVWLRPSRSKSGSSTPGALVDPQPLSLNPSHGPLPSPSGGWPSEVVPALALLLQDQHGASAAQSWISIHAAYQEQALDSLLELYPAYYERGSTPLTRAENLPLQLQWQDDDDASQQLRATVVADTPSQLLRGVRLWYVQPKALRFGLVDGDLTLVSALARVPRIQPEQVDALRRRLQESNAKPTLPPPNPRGPIEIIDRAPESVLQLRGITVHLGHRKIKTTLGCARLVFDYDGLRLPHAAPKARERRLLGERVLEIRRHLAHEREMMGKLQQLGLAEIGWYSDPRGIPAKLVQPSDLMWHPNRSKLPQATSAWEPLIEQLQEAGFQLEYADSFPRQRLVEIDDWHADVQPAGNQWFDVSLGIDVGGHRVDLLPLLRRMLSDPEFPLVAPPREKKDASWRVTLDAKRSVDIPLTRLRALIEPLMEWLQGDDALHVHRTRAEALVNMATSAQLHWRGGDILRAQLDLLKNAARDASPPPGFNATLRPYQREGLAWLNFLGDSGLGGILADDMGLGKTVQVLAHILTEKQRGRLEKPALVVAPTSLVGNWRDETARFAPDLKVLVLHGPQRADEYHLIPESDLVITTYPLLPRDEERLREAQFSLLVLDEAQAIKNPHSQAAKVVRTIPATRRLAMTGTPMENHLGELWAQFDAVEPGLLGSERQFAKLYRTPIEKHNDNDCQQRLNRRVSALLLRRRKKDVLTDLPAKTEIVHKLELADAQRGLYETLRLTQHERVQQAVKERGLSQAGIIVLDALLKLRQACCDPRLVKLPSARKITQSAKLDALLELLDSLLADNSHVLVFSQFTEMLALIETALQKREINYQILTGQTPARQRTALVKKFQSGTVPVFLISLKAGGIGLNLTAADTVIHYDPWWNPAVEAQATDRAHRIGQDKPVFVYRLICTGTVEEKIQALQARKADLAAAVLDGGGATKRLRFDETDLAELFAPM